MRSHQTDATVSAQLELIFGMLRDIHLDLRALRREIFSNKETIMSALDDLKAAMAALVTEAVTDLELVLGKISNAPQDDTADLVALTKQANDAIAKLKADMAPLTTPAPAAPAADAPAAAPTDGATDQQSPPSS